MAATISNASVNATTITVTGTGGVIGGKVGVFLDNVLQSPRATPDGSGNWTLALTNVSAGAHQVRAADIITTTYSVTTEFVPATVSAGSSVGPVTEDITPQVIGTITNPNGASVSGLSVTVYYKVQGAADYLVAGSAVSDDSGNYVLNFTTELPDALYDFYAQVNGVIIKSSVASVTVSKPNEAPIMPASSADWLDASGEPNRPEGKYGYFSALMVGIGAPNGWEIGRVLPINTPKGGTLVISMEAAPGHPGAAAGLAINPSTGMVAVEDTTQITISGLRMVKITATNDVGSSSYIGPIEVVAASQGKRFYSKAGNDANSGNVPHLPRISKSGATASHYYRRGDVWTDPTGLGVVSGAQIRSYGDPALPNPLIDSDTGPGCLHNNDNGERSNLLIQDIDFMGAERCVMLTNGINNKFYRVKAAGNSVKSGNSQGFYLHNQRNFKMYHCSTQTVYGDGLIMTRPNVVDIGWSTFDVPNGGAADCVQITFLGRVGDVGYDVYFHDNTMYQLSSSSSLKGSLVIEGITRYLCERNYMQGKYFAMSNQGAISTVRDNHCVDAKYPATNTNAFAIGAGGSRGLPDPNDWAVSNNQQVYDNLVEDSLTALAISGHSDGDTLQRPDMEWQWNDVRRCTNIGKLSRATSGVMNFNLGTACTNSTVIKNNPGSVVATGGDFTTMETTPNYTQATQGPLCTVLPEATGTVQEGQAITYNTGTWSGSPVSFEYVSRLNGREIARSSSANYVVGAGLAAQNNPYLPLSMQKAELSCVVIATDAQGRKGFAVARFPALTNFMTNKVKYAPILAA